MPCKFIAEIGWNWMGDEKLAEEMIKAAKQAGADYAKFQTWKVNRLIPGPWDTDGRRQIYEKAELTEERHKLFNSFCKKYDIKFLTSCFCYYDLDFIRSITNEIKIPGHECGNKELVERAINRFDRVYVSTGAHKYEEYSHLAYEPKVTLMHCVSAYPCKPENLNLEKFKYLYRTTKGNLGFSGHCEGIWDAITAACLGATIIEKHFTIDKNLPGRDNKFALLPEEFKQIVDYSKTLDKFWEKPDSEDNPSLYLDFQECEREIREKYRGRWG